MAVAFDGAVWTTRTDGVFYIVDQMHCIWPIQDASHHFLLSNLSRAALNAGQLLPSRVVLSGAGLAPLGWRRMAVPSLWKPVAVLAFFFGVRRSRGASLAGVWPRRVVLVLTLFFGCYTYFYGTGACSATCSQVPELGLLFALMGLAAMVCGIGGVRRGAPERTPVVTCRPARRARRAASTRGTARAPDLP